MSPTASQPKRRRTVELPHARPAKQARTTAQSDHPRRSHSPSHSRRAPSPPAPDEATQVARRALDTLSRSPLHQPSPDPAPACTSVPPPTPSASTSSSSSQLSDNPPPTMTPDAYGQACEEFLRNGLFWLNRNGFSVHDFSHAVKKAFRACCNDSDAIRKQAHRAARSPRPVPVPSFLPPLRQASSPPPSQPPPVPTQVFPTLPDNPKQKNETSPTENNANDNNESGDNDDGDGDDNNGNGDNDGDGNVTDSPTPVRARQKTRPPPSFLDALQAKINAEQPRQAAKTVPPCTDYLDRPNAAKRLQTIQSDGTLSQDDLQKLGLAFYGDMLGRRGQKRLVSAFLELYSPYGGYRARERERAAGDASQGPAAEIARLVARFGEAVVYDGEQKVVCEDIRIFVTRANLVRDYDYWQEQTTDDADGTLAAFLDGQKIVRKPGANLSSRVAKYIEREIGLPSGRLTKIIYQWRPLAILESVFGRGVFALLPRSLTTAYVSLSGKKVDGVVKETKFRQFIAAAAKELPAFYNVCDACDTYIVRPLLAGRPGETGQLSLPTQLSGIQWAQSGKLRELQRANIVELLDIDVARLLTRPLGIVLGEEEVSEEGEKKKNKIQDEENKNCPREKRIILKRRK